MTPSTDLSSIIKAHPFFKGLDSHYLPILVESATLIQAESQSHMAREGETATGFFLIRSGHVAIEMFVPKKGAMILETIGPGDVFGWSWIFPPYRWSFDARAVETSEIIAFDGTSLRKKCEENPKLGYDLMKRFAQIMSHRIHASRLQLLDLYGGSKKHEGVHGSHS